MKKLINLIPKKENIHFIENFIEYVSDYHHLSDIYFANITMAVTEASNVLYTNFPEEEIEISFNFNSEGLHFEIAGKLDWNDLVKSNNNTSNLESAAGREIFVIWSMPDKLKILENGKKIRMTFEIEEIEESTSDRRATTMSRYFQKEEKHTKNS